MSHVFDTTCCEEPEIGAWIGVVASTETALATHRVAAPSESRWPTFE